MMLMKLNWWKWQLSADAMKIERDEIDEMEKRIQTVIDQSLKTWCNFEETKALSLEKNFNCIANIADANMN
jgi:hypothetical protein